MTEIAGTYMRVPAFRYNAFEIALWLPSFADVDAEYARLSKLGLQFPTGEPITHPFCIRNFYVADPEGNLLEIGSTTEASFASPCHHEIYICVAHFLSAQKGYPALIVSSQGCICASQLSLILSHVSSVLSAFSQASSFSFPKIASSRKSVATVDVAMQKLRGKSDIGPVVQ